MMRLQCFLAVAGAALAMAHGADAQTSAPGSAPLPAATQAPTLPPQEPAQPTIRDDRESIDAGMKWLALIDSGKAGAAWDLSSQQLKSAVTRDKFVAGMRDARKPYGKLEARTPERFARSHQMPGVPDGDYVLIEYKARFANGEQLTEHLVWKFEDGEIWRVAGYTFR